MAFYTSNAIKFARAISSQLRHQINSSQQHLSPINVRKSFNNYQLSHPHSRSFHSHSVTFSSSTTHPLRIHTVTPRRRFATTDPTKPPNVSEQSSTPGEIPALVEAEILPAAPSKPNTAAPIVTEQSTPKPQVLESKTSTANPSTTTPPPPTTPVPPTTASSSHIPSEATTANATAAAPTTSATAAAQPSLLSRLKLPAAPIPGPKPTVTAPPLFAAETPAVTVPPLSKFQKFRAKLRRVFKFSLIFVGIAGVSSLTLTYFWFILQFVQKAYRKLYIPRTAYEKLYTYADDEHFDQELAFHIDQNNPIHTIMVYQLLILKDIFCINEYIKDLSTFYVRLSSRAPLAGGEEAYLDHIDGALASFGQMIEIIALNSFSYERLCARVFDQENPSTLPSEREIYDYLHQLEHAWCYTTAARHNLEKSLPQIERVTTQALYIEEKYKQLVIKRDAEALQRARDTKERQEFISSRQNVNTTTTTTQEQLTQDNAGGDDNNSLSNMLKNNIIVRALQGSSTIISNDFPRPTERVYLPVALFSSLNDLIQTETVRLATTFVTHGHSQTEIQQNNPANASSSSLVRASERPTYIPQRLRQVERFEQSQYDTYVQTRVERRREHPDMPLEIPRQETMTAKIQQREEQLEEELDRQAHDRKRSQLATEALQRVVQKKTGQDF